MPLRPELFVSRSSLGAYDRYGDDHELKRPLRVERIERGIILPLKTEYRNGGDIRHAGGVLSDRGEFVPLSGSRRAGTEFRKMASGYEIAHEPEYCDETVIYGGILWRYYGHVLLETMSRMWYFVRDNHERYRVVFDVDDTARGKFAEFFELLGIPCDDRTFIVRPTRYAAVIVPEPAFIYDGYWHRDWLIPYDFMAEKVEPAGVEKIYFTRTRIEDRNPVYGEKPIERIFARNGFRVFSPERLSLRRQISLVKGCRCLAAVASSVPHNLLFAHDGVELICLNRCPTPNFGQRLVDEARGVRTTYVDAWLNPLPVAHGTGPWIVGLTEELAAFFGARKMHFCGKIGRVRVRDAVRFLTQWIGQNRSARFSDEDVKICQSRVWGYTTWFGLPAQGLCAKIIRRIGMKWGKEDL